MAVHAAKPAPATTAPAREALSAAALLERAEHECEALEYELCAETAMAVVVDPRATLDERTRARWIAGSAQRIIGKDVDARMTFRALLVDAPRFVPPDDTPAKVAQFFALVAAELASETAQKAAAPSAAVPAIGLVIESVPVGAQVFVDGNLVGVTPVTVADVKPGLRELVIAAPSGDRVDLAANVFAGGQTAVRVAFREPRATVIRTRPADALVDDASAVDGGAIASTVAKGVAAAVTCVGGGCAGCIGIFGSVTLGSALGVDSSLYSAVAYGTCSALWLAAAVSAAGLAGWAVVDVVEFAAPDETGLVHAVDVVPPRGHGKPRTFVFTVEDEGAGAKADDAVAY